MSDFIQSDWFTRISYGLMALSVLTSVLILVVASRPRARRREGGER